jgi:hypothetical protein
LELEVIEQILEWFAKKKPKWTRIKMESWADVRKTPTGPVLNAGRKKDRIANSSSTSTTRREAGRSGGGGFSPGKGRGGLART